VAKKIEGLNREVLEVMKEYFNDQMDFRQILTDFPESNINLKYPALALTAQAPEIMTYSPHVHSSEQVNSALYRHKYIVGQYNWSIQADLWERTKEECYDLQEEFFTKFANMWPSQAGLNLVLKNYHDVICSYQIVSNSREDAEIASQRKEWRAIIAIQANCKAIRVHDVPIMEDIEVNPGDAGDIVVTPPNEIEIT
jgi:hypothetical protein